MKTLDVLADGFFENLVLYTHRPKNEAFDEKQCFRNALRIFLQTGRKEDAFVVYFCYSEIFKMFGSGYDNTQKLLETLSDHEYHTGELLPKHRDHYSHSVYVFALGLVMYEYDSAFRRAFVSFYGMQENDRAKFSFLKLWGMTALFHDIGYPFQLAHEHIKAYTEELWGNIGESPYVSFGNMDNFLRFDERVQKSLAKAFGRSFTDINELLCYGVNLRDGYDEKELCDILVRRILKQKNFMDHGYFSSVILLKQLSAVENFNMDIATLDVLTAILLHNSLNKYDIKDAHPIAIDEHPLAYLLMLCDELQNWDRFAYGKVSRNDPIAWSVNLEINRNVIEVKYFYDSSTVKALFQSKHGGRGAFYKFSLDNEEYSHQENSPGVRDGEERLNKSFAEIQSGLFVAKIIAGYTEEKDGKTKRILPFISSDLKIYASAEVEPKRKSKKVFVSDNSFINLCDFAKAIHSSYTKAIKDLNCISMNKEFGNLPLEFKISNIEQAKSYMDRLELINCFYSNKDLDYDVIDDLETAEYGNPGEKNFEFLCRGEHVRWVGEKLAMGWRYGVENEDYTETDRQLKKLNSSLVPYDCLDKDSIAKTKSAMRNISVLLRKLGNNSKIYRFRPGFKPDFVIAGIGHRYISESVADTKEEVKKILKRYNDEKRDDHNVIVRTGMAYGSDQIIAECAVELGITIKAALPYGYDDFIKYVRDDAIAHGVDYTAEDENRLRGLLAQCVVIKFFGDKEDGFTASAEYSMEKCDRLIAIWDTKEMPLSDEKGNPINRGGTYHCLQMVKKRLGNVEINTISCHRK